MGNNPWVFIGITVIVGFVFITGLAALISLVMSVVSGHTADKTVNSYLDELEQMLPGRNCGDCGCKNCRFYAEVLLNRDLTFDKCPHGDENLPERLEACVERFWKVADDRDPVDKKRFWRRRGDL